MPTRLLEAVNNLRPNFFIILLLSIYFMGAEVSAKKAQYGPGTTMIAVKNKTQKHFDLDRDGYLNRFEHSLLTTHLYFNYPLVKKKKQIPYDFDNNRMLQPYELQMYLKDKKKGQLKKYVKKKEEKIVAGRGGLKF